MSANDRSSCPPRRCARNRVDDATGTTLTHFPLSSNYCLAIGLELMEPTNQGSAGGAASHDLSSEVPLKYCPLLHLKHIFSSEVHCTVDGMFEWLNIVQSKKIEV